MNVIKGHQCKHCLVYIPFIFVLHWRDSTRQKQYTDFTLSFDVILGFFE